MELSTHVGRSVLESAQARQIEPPQENRTEYWVRLGNPPSDNPEEGTYNDQEYYQRNPEEITTEAYRIRVQTFPEDPQQLSGSVRQEGPRSPNVNVRFVYKDIRDLGFGAVVIIVTGIAAFMCAGALVTGYYANRKCTKVDVSYNFGFNLWGQSAENKTGCTVKCIEGATE
jgi:hypothetical protein